MGIFNHLPAWAYLYAVEYGPCDVSRQISCDNPFDAYNYARDVDRCPRQDTRKATCKDPCFAFRYARDVASCVHEVTIARTPFMLTVMPSLWIGTPVTIPVPQLVGILSGRTTMHDVCNDGYDCG